MPQFLLNFLHLSLFLALLGGSLGAQAQKDQSAYQEHLRAAQKVERERLSGLDEYKKKKAQEEKEREKAREAFKRQPVNKLKKVREFDEYLEVYQARQAERERLEERFSQRQRSQQGFDELKVNLFEDRPRVDQAKRSLYTDPAAAGGGRGSSVTSRGSFSRSNRFGRNDRDDRNEDRGEPPPPVIDRGRDDEAFVEEELPPEPPPFIEEGVEPRYDEDYIEDGEVMSEGGGDDYPPPPPPPPPPEAFEEDL